MEVGQDNCLEGRFILPGDEECIFFQFKTIITIFSIKRVDDLDLTPSANTGESAGSECGHCGHNGRQLGCPPCAVRVVKLGCPLTPLPAAEN